MAWYFRAKGRGTEGTTPRAPSIYTHPIPDSDTTPHAPCQIKDDAPPHPSKLGSSVPDIAQHDTKASKLQPFGTDVDRNLSPGDARR
ncbi:hypothetical protein B0H10DRAFT_2238466 [Mycena sp. CBHHK59/15]|nr:hypothetical protein B0H10DRAFT_2238466 [Mycena sp. CBHHK59/15]